MLLLYLRILFFFAEKPNFSAMRDREEEEEEEEGEGKKDPLSFLNTALRLADICIVSPN